MANVSLGSISHGTLKTEDLFNAFLDEAKNRFPDHVDVKSGVDILKSLEDIMNVLDDDDAEDLKEKFYDSEVTQDAVNELQDLLGTDLPPFWYFGAHEGDGSDFGYWFSNDSFETAVNDGEVLKVDDLGDVDFNDLPDGTEYVAVVSDHGNIELYDAQGNNLYGVV